MIRQNFNADWTVEKGDGNSRMNSFLGNTQTKTVHLPYDAMIHEARTPDTEKRCTDRLLPRRRVQFFRSISPHRRRGKASRCPSCLRACTRRRWST